MATRLDAPGVRPPTPVDNRAPTAPLGDARQQAFQRALQSLVGQTVTAQVLSQYSDGSYLVRVADTNARMQLPAGLAAGAELPLTVVAAEPRPTFQLDNGQRSGATEVTTPPPAAPEAELPDLPPLPPRPAPTAAGGGQPVPSQTSAAPAAAPATQTKPGLPLPPPDPAPAEQARPQASANAPAPLAARAASLAATLLGKAPLTPAEQLPPLSSNTLAATLSPAARALTSALTAAYPTPGVPVTIQGKLPLSAGGAPDPAQLSQRLQQALGDSGLFYESHVAQWAAGQRPLQDLQREPQMQRQVQLASQGKPEPAAQAAQGGPDLSAAQMINQQLHTQEQGKLHWQGEAWPGQPMQWRVERDSGDGGGQQRSGRDEEAAAPIWRSGVRFRFPLLGKVGANVTLVGDQVHLQVLSATEDTAGTLRAWAGQLQDALAAAGAPLASLTIQAEDDHEAG